MIRIPLDLSGHCIQTEIRRLYNRFLSACLKFPERDALAEMKIELLKQALETWDFSTLRADFQSLAGGQADDVALVADDAGRLFIVINEQTIPV